MMSFALSGQTAVTIGNFDGVHIGHRALVSRCRSLVGESGRVIAMAFSPHPMTVLNPDHAPGMIESAELRIERLLEAGADRVELIEPTPEFLSMSAQGFVDHVIDAHGPAVLVEGTDFRFGKRRAGNPLLLKELASVRGVEVQIVNPVEVAITDQSIVKASSSMTRWLIAHGRVRDAAFLLGRPHELVGSVVQGDQLGRTIGYRTANLETQSMLPADGVYATLVQLPDGTCTPGAMNIGSRPTVDGVSRRAEVHVVELDGQPWAPADGFPEYGWDVRVQLVGWIRDQIKFASIDALSEQLARDVDRALPMVERLLNTQNNITAVQS